MKAVVYDKYAPNDDYKSILNVKEVPEPKPKPNEVVFRVKAAALNYNDIWGMRGQPVPVPLPHPSLRRCCHPGCRRYRSRLPVGTISQPIQLYQRRRALQL